MGILQDSQFQQNTAKLWMLFPPNQLTCTIEGCPFITATLLQLKFISDGVLARQSYDPVLTEIAGQ
jgi:hypothetical protein